MSFRRHFAGMTLEKDGVSFRPFLAPLAGSIVIYTSLLLYPIGATAGQLGENESGDLFGRALITGDFDGDGIEDLVIGAPGEAPGNDPKSGFLFIYRGTLKGPVRWHGLDQEGIGENEAWDDFGFALAAGDVNGDGRADLIVGGPGEKPGNGPESGYAYLFYGQSGNDQLAPHSGIDQQLKGGL